MSRTIGKYEIVRTLGEGGMGTVYEARDESLGRSVALKLIHDATSDELRARFRREARAAARVSHPNICQIFEVGEEEGEPFLVMELLDGEPLDEVLGGGPLGLAKATDVALEMLSALEALHRERVVHRDLKPSNVFLTPYGVKLLDFGLALPVGSGEETADLDLTKTGTILGTPRYMSPEQWLGQEVSPASDLFSCGSILFEMLAGRPAFGGESMAEVCHAVVYAEPPALTGRADVVGVDQVIQVAMAKEAVDRYASAAQMDEALRAARDRSSPASSPSVSEFDETMARDGAPAAPVQTVQRLIVLPFRLLRPDEEIDFLPFSLADAVSSSLSGLRSLVIRSNSLVDASDVERPDVRKIARKAEVDSVLLGTLLRLGNQIRVTAELVEASSGTVAWSHTSQASVEDLFSLQDELTQRIVDGLAVPLSAREQERLEHLSPAKGEGYELYLRARDMEVRLRSDSALSAALNLYEASVDEDPSYAPAWARLARMHYVTSKYSARDWKPHRDRAEEAFARAFALEPNLPLAHNFYTFFEVETLQQAPDAMVRLLQQAKSQAADPDLYAGLVVACRFCGLLEPSVAAIRRVRRLDPYAKTSAEFTYWMAGDFEASIRHSGQDPPVFAPMAMAMIGREAESVTTAREIEAAISPMVAQWVAVSRTAVERDREACVKAADLVIASGMRDPEGLYFVARSLARVGLVERAAEMLDEIVAANFLCAETLRADPWLEDLAGDKGFQGLVAKAEAGHQQAVVRYLEAGGESILGPPGS